MTQIYPQLSKDQLIVEALGQKERAKIGKKKIPKAVKEAIWNIHIGSNKAEGMCFVGCGNKIFMQGSGYHAGHVISEANGGPATVDNLRPICASCNGSMGSTNMDVFMRTHGLKTHIVHEKIPEPTKWHPKVEPAFRNPSISYL